MHAAILSSVTCPRLQYFSKLSHNRHDFKKKKNVIVYKMCVLIFSKHLSEIFHFLIRIERDMIKYVVWSSCKVSVILVGF